MASLLEYGVGLLSSTAAVDLNNAVAATSLFTVPAGKKCVVHKIVLRNLSANATAATVTFGQVGALTDFLNTQTLSGLNAAAATGVLMPIPNATTVKAIEYTAAEIFQINVTVAAGIACTCTIDVYGSLADA